jgi:hypothetical protein
MSVIVTVRLNGDVERYRNIVETQGDTLGAISEDAKTKGCLHHRHALGDGYVLVVDEWESAEACQEFFEGNEAIANLMGSFGAQGEPEISIGEALDTPDTF